MVSTDDLCTCNKTCIELIIYIYLFGLISCSNYFKIMNSYLKTCDSSSLRSLRSCKSLLIEKLLFNLTDYVFCSCVESSEEREIFDERQDFTICSLHKVSQCISISGI